MPPPADPRHPWYALVGPTATGKTEASIRIAERLGAEILNVDSMLVYRGLDVGTAKPSPAERDRVRHHLIDVVEPGRAYSIALHQRLAREALAGMGGRGARVLVVGGSGLYFRAVVDDLDLPPTEPAVRRELEAEAAAVGAERLHERLRAFDPEAAARIEPGNVRRTVRALEVAALTGRRFSSYAMDWERFPAQHVRVAGVDMPPEVLRRRIEDRVRRQLQEGLLAEVRRLMEDGFGRFLTARQAIGYAEMVDHLSGRLSLDEAAARTVKRTRALARRQLAWFRRDPRVGWFEAGEEGGAALADEIGEYLAGG